MVNIKHTMNKCGLDEGDSGILRRVAQNPDPASWLGKG